MTCGFSWWTASLTSGLRRGRVVLVTNGHEPWPVLRQGPNSVWPKVTVRSLQYLLNAHGARLAIDVHGFPVDGIAGPLSWQALVTEVLAG